MQDQCKQNSLQRDYNGWKSNTLQDILMLFFFFLKKSLKSKKKKSDSTQEIWFGHSWKLICIDESWFCNFSHPREFKNFLT